MKNTKFQSALQRAARTFVQGFLGVTTLGALTAADLTAVHALEAGLIAGGYAILMAFAIPPKGE
jgi:hypothetical protein